jgi:hypothetical protein
MLPNAQPGRMGKIWLRAARQVTCLAGHISPLSTGMRFESEAEDGTEAQASSRARGTQNEMSDETILKALRTEENWAEIGRQHNISRERVRKIALDHGIKKRISFEVAIALVHPFLKHANTELCWRCGAELELRKERRNQKFCTRCRKLLEAIGRAKASLRTFVATGSHIALAKAAYNIRRFGLLPEDFTSVAPTTRDKGREARSRRHLDRCQCPLCASLSSETASPSPISRAK